MLVSIAGIGTTVVNVGYQGITGNTTTTTTRTTDGAWQAAARVANALNSDYIILYTIYYCTHIIYILKKWTATPVSRLHIISSRESIDDYPDLDLQRITHYFIAYCNIARVVRLSYVLFIHQLCLYYIHKHIGRYNYISTIDYCYNVIR